MSSDEIVLKAEKREVTGKKVAKLRRDGKIPAVVYERGKDSDHIMIEIIPLQKVWLEAGKNHVIKLEIEGAKRLTLIKDVDFDPSKGNLRHVAFHAIKQNEKVEAEVPIEITGEVPAEKVGFFLVRPLTEVQVKALPADLPDKLEVSGEGLAEVGDSVTVADLKVPANVEIMEEPDRPLAIVEESRADIEAEAEAEAAEGEEAGESASDVPSEHGGGEADSSDQPESKD